MKDLSQRDALVTGSLPGFLLIIMCSLVLLSLGSCIGDNAGSSVTLPLSPASSTAPVIYAELNSFPSGSAPANFVSAVVHIYKDMSGHPLITDASVNMNNVTLPYNAGHADYEGNVVTAPGENVTLSVAIGGKTYTASGTQFTSYPAIASPAANTLWSPFYTNTIAWSAGAPETNAFYAFKFVDAADPNTRIWPLDTLWQEVPTGVTSYSLIGQDGVDSPLWGDRLLFVGIAQQLPIPHASSDSYLMINGLNSVPVAFRYEIPDLSFGSGSGYPEPVSGNMYLADTVIGDLNGDGRNDVAVIEDYGPHILIYYQDSNGALTAPPLVITTDIKLVGIAAADVNNDGLLDLVVSGDSTTAGYPGRVAVFLQDPTAHTLGAEHVSILSTSNTGRVAAADLNNDGRIDVVSAGVDSVGNGVVSFLFQGPGGTLNSEVTYTHAPVVVNGEVHVGDMNNDGLNDVVLQSGLKQIAVIKQTSPGTFSSTPDFYTVQTTHYSDFWSFALGDLNNDGLTDLAVMDPGNSGYLNIFTQNTSGTLSGPILRIVSGQAQNEVDIADLNGDGLNDILVISCGYEVQILYQAADHSFGNPFSIYFPTATYGGTAVHDAMSIGDVTGDGLPDIVSSWSTEGVFVLPRLP